MSENRRYTRQEVGRVLCLCKDLRPKGLFTLGETERVLGDL